MSLSGAGGPVRTGPGAGESFLHFKPFKDKVWTFVNLKLISDFSKQALCEMCYCSDMLMLTDMHFSLIQPDRNRKNP